MKSVPVSATPEGDEFETHCTCCGRPIYWGHGWLDSMGAALAAYWYQWSEGHQGRFTLALARFDSQDNLIPGVSSVIGWIEGDALRYSIVEPIETNWGNMVQLFGPLLSRETILVHKARIFELVDAIVANEKRISTRILSVGLQD